MKISKIKFGGVFESVDWGVLRFGVRKSKVADLTKRGIGAQPRAKAVERSPVTKLILTFDVI